MQAIVRRTSDPASVAPTTIELPDLESLIDFIYDSEHACILVVEGVDGGGRSLQIEIYDEV